MRRIALLAILAGFVVPLMASAPAHAQATRTWVSGVGDDANPCSRTAPCKTFAGAISKTAASGEINCIDPGGFGALTITKAITIACPGVEAGILVSGTNGFVVAAGVNDVVVIKNIDFVGVGTGLAAIKFQSGAALHVEDCNISGFVGFGIAIVPTNASTFTVTRTTLVNNAAGGIQVKPTTGFVGGRLDRVLVTRSSGPGISVDSTGGVGALAVSINDSGISGNTSADGIIATAGALNNVMVNRSVISNAGNGLNATGGATIRVGYSSITGNGTATTGNVLSYGTNQINGNGVDTIPTGVALH